MMLINKINKLYYKCTIKVTTLIMYPKFKSMRDNIDTPEGPTINPTSTKEHVTEIEQTIRYLKEKMKSLKISLTCK